MGREMRRAQQRADRRQQRQQRGPQTSGRGEMGGIPTSTAGPGEPVRRGGSLLKPRWAMDIISELRKVTWPSRRDVANLTMVVIVVSALLGVLLGAADLAFGWLVEETLLR